MSSVTHLTQHLLKLDPQKSVARQALFNFLKNYTDGASPLTAETLRGFFNYILNFQYWQTNGRTLGETIKADMELFAQQSRLDFDLKTLRFPHEVQVLTLEQSADFEFLLEKQESTLVESGGRLKMLKLSDQQRMVLILNRSGGLRVRVFNRLGTIREGQIELLSPVTDLTYASNLELYPNALQLLEGQMVMTARFHLTDDGCQGLLVRGHMLQKYETLAGGAVSAHPELFYSLKRIERHFVSSQSDPFYKDLVSQLERTYQLLNAGHPEARKLAPAVLQKGKTALKNIFPNDKLLLVLVTNIEFALISPAKDQWARTETNLSLD